MPSESYLNINESLTAFSDVGLTNNPLMRHFDWSRNMNGLVVFNPKAEQHLVPPRSRLAIFDTLRSLSFNGTTAIDVSYLVDNTYRFKFAGGTDPVFAINVPLVFVGTQFTVAVNSNQTVTMAANAAVFGAVAGGSYIYIYSPTDNPAASFSVLNSGVWVVLSANANTLVLARPTNTAFQGTGQIVTCDAASNMLNYTLASVQIGDKVRIDTPFASGSRGTYVVSGLTSKWVDVTSTTPIVSETGILPNTTGMIFFGASKRFTRVETDQRAKVYFNGSISEADEIEPWAPGDRKLMGWQEKVGPVWALAVYNTSTVPMVVNVFTCE